MFCRAGLCGEKYKTLDSNWQLTVTKAMLQIPLIDPDAYAPSAQAYRSDIDYDLIRSIAATL